MKAAGCVQRRTTFVERAREDVNVNERNCKRRVMEERIERAAHFLMPLPAREEMHNEKLGELA